MKFCPNCGTQTEPGATNCFNCGFALPQPKAPSPTNQPSGPTPTKFDDYPVGVQDEPTTTTNDDSHALTWLITAIIMVTVVIAGLIFIF